MKNVSIVNSLQFLSVSLKLGIEACRIVKDSYNNKNVKQYLKAVDDPVTEADYKIQSMLIKGFRMQYSNIKIVGQQQKQYQGIVETQYQKLLLPQLPVDINSNIQYQTNKCCLWIDPIDNTKGFIKGQAQAVTTLIGMSYNNKSQLGVIGIPFKKNKDKIYYNPSLLVGSATSGFAYEYYPKENRWVNLRLEQNTKEKKLVALSPYRQNTVQNLIVDHIKAQKIYAGGSGYKMSMVAKKQADIMAYSYASSYKWDTCAGQAIIKGMKGYCSSQFGQQIRYQPNNPKQLNKNGVICTLDNKIFTDSIQICKKHRKNKNQF